MPGVIIFGRRWSVGSDDFVVPGMVLFSIHLAWLITLSLILYTIEFDRSVKCIDLLWYYIAVYTSLEFALSINELFVCIISMRGSILNTGERSSILYWLYFRLILMLCNFTLIGLGITWAVHHYQECAMLDDKPKEIMVGCVFCNLFLELFVVMTMYCVFDPAGRSWVKMKKYQRSMKEAESRFNYRRSGSTNRNWRQRKVIRAYQDSWNQRCRFFFCCLNTSDRNRNSFTDIAKLLSDFFRDLDVVPSDVVAGLILLRKFQKLEREAIARQKRDGIFEYLSGVPITEETQFLALNGSNDYEQFQNVIHYMYYAISAYGWPMYLITHSKMGMCDLCPNLNCFLCGRRDKAEIIEDNCLGCNVAALKQMLSEGDVELIYVTYHVDIGETPFFVAVDYIKQKIVISIRGTLSMQDILTDLNAEGEPLPLNPPREDWLAHKGMVQAAVYIKNKLQEEDLIQKALNHNPARGTQNYGLVFVGHSLGAGTASILAILMREEYTNLQCFSYSPAGGLLSMPAVEYSKDFIISVVVGKDLVPRIGLHQMEALRNDLINAIQRSIDPKWKTIACNMICCCCGPEPTSVMQMSEQDSRVNAYKEHKDASRHSTVHPNDNSIALTLHHPLYPPGRIIHVVRHHPTDYESKYENEFWRQAIKKHAPVYQAIWAKTTDFDEVLISPVMLQDHMPDTVLSALEKVITNVGPRKPQRQSHHEIVHEYQPSSKPPPKSKISQPQQLTPNSQRILLETAFGIPPNPLVAPTTNGIHNVNGHNVASVPMQKIATRNPKTVAFKPTTLSLCETRPNPYPGHVDLIHDDWFGLAPLASPESLSELSSISSRTSISLNLNLSNSVENFLNKHIVNVKTPTPPPDIDIDESQLRTPVVIRRTPKFSENLASCAEDWKSQNNYKRMGQVFITTPKLHDSDSDGDGSFGTPKNISFDYSININNNINSSLDESSTPTQKANRRYVVSADDCTSQCPVCPCTKLPSESCCQRADHIACIMMSVQEQKCSGKYSITNTTSSSDTYYSLTTGSECGDNFMSNGSATKVLLSKLGTYDEETLTCELTSAQNCNETATVSSITKSGILESHFPVYFDSSDERSSLLSNENESPRARNCQSQKKMSNGNNSTERKKSNDAPTNEINSRFTRNESLPLLSSLLEKSSPTNYMKRKKVIYPIHTPPIRQHSPRTTPTVRSKSTPSSVTNLYIFHNESNV